jgi:hypothetical protein
MSVTWCSSTGARVAVSLKNKTDFQRLAAHPLGCNPAAIMVLVSAFVDLQVHFHDQNVVIAVYNIHSSERYFFTVSYHVCRAKVLQPLRVHCL